MIDFLQPEDDNIQDPVTPVVPTPDPVTPDDSTPIIDFLESTGDVNVEDDPIAPIPGVTPKSTPSDTKDYTDVLQSLLEKGAVSTFPESFDNSADRGPLTLKELEEVVEYNNSLKEEEIANSTIQNILGKMSPELQKAYEYEVNGGKPSDYLKVLIEVQDLKELDITNVNDQERIVKEFYKNTGLEPDEIKEKIQDLKDASLLEKEASKLKPKLDKRAEDIAQAKLDSQNAIANQKKGLAQVAANRITDKLVKGIDNIKFSKNEANELLTSIMVEQDFKYGDDVQTKTTLEYLIDYHKYSSQGDPARVLKALMILEPSGKYDEKFAKLIKDQMVDKFTADHLKDSKNKFQVKTPQSTTPSKPAQSKFKFQS